jgi:transposase InsO family protein
MTAELNARGHACSENTVAKLMREHGIRAKAPRRFVRTTDSRHGLPVAENVLDREFDPSEPNAAWAADITYIPTADGWLYLAVVEDLFSRMIVGWAMAETMESRLVVDALEMAVRRRLPGEGLVAHSDRGTQYASDHYRRLLDRHGITCSMSRVAQCWDNAPVESFFATLKRELVHDERYATREQLVARVGPQPGRVTGSRRAVRHPGAGPGEHLRVRRGVLQPRPPALLPGARVPRGVRADAQPETPLTSTPLFLGMTSAVERRQCHPLER